MSLLIKDEESTPNYKLVIGKHNAKEKGTTHPPTSLYILYSYINILRIGTLEKS